ncbi:MAG: hypothetical protein WC470_01405 [Candidatus Paceibacterota bacterium]
MIKKIPYTLKIILPVAGWVGLCGFFAMVLINTTARMDALNAREFFFIFVLAILIILAIFTLIRMGNFSFNSKEVRAINKNITNGELNPSLTLDEIKETFYYLVHFCRNNFINIIWAGLVVTFVVGMVMKFYKHIPDSDVLIIFSGGVVATVLSAVFASFYSEQATFSAVKASRQKIIEAESAVPDINFDSIGSKFYFLFIFPIITTLVVLVCVFPFSLNVAILSVIGMAMVLIIDRVLFIYIAKSFFEAEGFIKGVTTGENKIFATGSVDKEFVDLIEGLNSAGQQALRLKKESDFAKKQMETRVDELERFFDLTVNREIKMVELKKQIKKIEDKKVKSSLSRKGKENNEKKL